MLRWFKKPEPEARPAPDGESGGWWVEVDKSAGYTTFYDFSVYNPKGERVITTQEQIQDKEARRRFANNLLAKYDKTRRREVLEVYR